jgi:transposase
MIDMALLSVLRRWHFRDGMPIREITRRTGLSRNTVHKCLASGELEPRYRRPKSPSKLDDYEQTLTSWLHRETKRPRKQRLTAKHLHQDLVQMLGHNWMQSNTGDYNSFRFKLSTTHQREDKTGKKNVN